MTSGVFTSIPIDQISVDRVARQRKDILDVADLSDSIRRLGLIHPIVITREFDLVAGERRLVACRALGWDNISVQFVDELSERTLKSIELEENIKRKNLTWEEEDRAIIELDTLCHEEATENLEPWSIEDTAKKIGCDKSRVSRAYAAIEAVEWKPELAKKSHSTAVRRIEVERQHAKESKRYGCMLHFATYNHIQCCSFHEWVRTYEGPKFNLIHCDFPYGIGFDKMGAQAGNSLGRYEDGFENYKNLLSTLSAALDIFTEESAHFIFWFSMGSYQFTFNHLSEQCGLNINPFPLIWVKSDNSGILPDPARGPRRIYETAFLASRGDRKIIQPKSNAFVGPSTSVIHPHEKSEEMLKYFFEMVVDDHTSLFDPTAGGGSALRAAKALGAKRVFGLEQDETWARKANLLLHDPDFDTGDPNALIGSCDLPDGHPGLLR